MSQPVSEGGSNLKNLVKEDTIDINGVLFQFKINYWRNCPTPEPPSDEDINDSANNMNKRKSSLSEERKMSKRGKYYEIKADPELYEKEREKERERYKKKKAKGKVVSINEKSPRDIRQQRKKWREASKKYREKKKQEKVTAQPVPKPVFIECTESDTTDKVECSEEKQEDDPLQSLKSKIRRIRYNEQKKRMKLRGEIKILKNKYSSLEKRYKRLQAKLDKYMRKENEEESITIENKPRCRKEQQNIERRNVRLIRDFYNDDCNSTIRAGKKEYITKNNIKRQKRYLNSPLNILYKKFKALYDSAISYGYFCKHRPFWVVFPKTRDRDTCACVVHSNIDLLLNCLHKTSIISEKNSEELVAALCCSPRNENCLKRSCDLCINKTLAYSEFSNDQVITYHQWERRKEVYIAKAGLRKETTVSVKKETQAKPLDVIHALDEKLPQFIDHIYKINCQYASMKNLKYSMKVNEAIIHVDFSENFGLKFGKEVQSFHFGGSRKEVCIHTAVIYTFDFHSSSTGTTSVATVSQCLRHDAHAVWAHIMPLLKVAIEKNPFIDSLHFLSDSPTAQYRNKYVFHMITQLKKDFPQIKQITWNYSEAGHGKGAPDGVGAVLKRTADKLVTFGNDIGTFDQFVNAMQNIESVLIIKVDEQEIKDKENVMPSNLKPFKGTLHVHQVLWAKDVDKLTFRKTSCFLCEPGKVCVHQKHLGFSKIPHSAADNTPLLTNTDNVVLLAATKITVSGSKVLSNVTNAPMTTTSVASVPSTSRDVTSMFGREAHKFLIRPRSEVKK